MSAGPHGFGVVLQPPGVGALRGRLNDVIADLAGASPAGLASDVRSVLRRYAGGADVVRLFPVPLWSFLHWALPARHPARGLAERAHAASLVLHLWDDHLVDGQLGCTAARLHWRGLLWTEFTAAACALAEAVAASVTLVDRHTTAYLEAIQSTEACSDTDSYCSRFARQAAVWTLVPTLLEEYGAAPPGVSAVVETFATAWRLTDDINDVRQDAAAGVRSAVWHELGVLGRRAWDAGTPPADAVGAAGMRLSVRAAQLLEAAAEVARRAALDGLVTEVRLSALGLTRR